ncbi:MAG: ABC transporter substrate-binding protein [Planctomycetaceae bacterium]|nr:MAG: ABC transporter substrate-binding protein [Planctomycetaceae bacterium]
MLQEYKKRLMRILFLSVAILCFTLPSNAFAEEVLKIGGTGCALGSIKILAGAFEKAHPGIEVTVLRSLGSGGAIKAASKNAIDIGISSRALKGKEKKPGLTVIEYARTPFVFVTNKDVNISDVTTEEIIRIYRGEKKTWPDGKRLRTLLRPLMDTEMQIIKKISPEVNKAIEIALSRHGMLIALTAQENVNNIERTPGAFGACTLTQVIAERRPLKILSYNGIIPSTKNLSNGSYPLFMPLLIVTNKSNSVPVRKFLSFVKSTEGIRILEKTGNLVIIR